MDETIYNKYGLMKSNNEYKYFENLSVQIENIKEIKFNYLNEQTIKEKHYTLDNSKIIDLEKTTMINQLNINNRNDKYKKEEEKEESMSVYLEKIRTNKITNEKITINFNDNKEKTKTEVTEKINKY